jgi:hypothetical protein
MSKQSPRSKSKQGRANNRPSNGAAARTNGKPANNATAGNAAAKTTTAPASTTTTTAKGIATQPKPATAAAKVSPSGPAKQPDLSSKPAGKSLKQQRKQQKVQNRLAQQQHDSKQRRNTIMLMAAAVVVVGGLIAYIIISNLTATHAQTVFNADYPPIDGVYCDQLEQTSYHHHVLLTIYIDGQAVSVPAYVGLAGDATAPTCYYWLHTHDTSGVLHIEAPSGGAYTLKDFLDIWQSFANTSSSITYPSQLAASTGWTIYVYNNSAGKQVNGGFSKVDISSNQAWHELITIMYNSPNAKPLTTYSWQSGL